MQIILGFIGKLFTDIFIGVINEAFKTPAEEFEVDDSGGSLDVQPASNIEFINLL